MAPIGNIVEWASDNLLGVWVSARNANGLLGGFDNLDETDTGSYSEFHRLLGGITAPLPIPEDATARTRGDGRTLHTWTREADTDNAYTLDMAVRDIDADAFFNGGTTHMLGYYWKMGVLGASGRSPQDSILLLHRYAKDTLTGKPQGYENALVFSNTLQAIGDDNFAQDTVGGARYSGVSNRVNRFPWGEQIVDATNYADGITDSWVSEFPVMFGTIVGDGALTAIPLEHTPADTDVYRVVIIDATATAESGTITYLTVASVDQEAKEFDVSAPLTDNHQYVYGYEFLPTEL